LSGSTSWSEELSCAAGILGTTDLLSAWFRGSMQSTMTSTSSWTCHEDDDVLVVLSCCKNGIGEGRMPPKLLVVVVVVVVASSLKLIALLLAHLAAYWRMMY
jgi:hypothetical protein